MTTPRQQLLSRLSIALAGNAARRALYPSGRMIEFGGEPIRVQFPAIEPGSVRMNELVEGLARETSDETWDYYMNLTDRGYDRLVREAVRRS